MDRPPRVARDLSDARPAFGPLATPDEQHLSLMRATVRRQPQPVVFSHLSAAAVWGLEHAARYPDRPHAIEAFEGGGRSNRGLRRHAVTIQPVPTQRGDFWVTDLPRTVVDVLRTEHPADALSALDSALRGASDRDPMSPDVAQTIVRSISGGRGVRQARELLSLGDARCESVGESISRWAIHEAGLPAPLLQQEFRDGQGVMRVDFWWPEFNLIGEFDGEAKYLRSTDATDSVDSAVGSVVAEKWREDRLRALGPGVTRWGWRTARTPGALAAHLRRAGLA